MDKRILDLVSDFGQWKGDTYRLAMMVAVLQMEIDREKLVTVGFTEAAGVI